MPNIRPEFAVGSVAVTLIEVSMWFTLLNAMDDSALESERRRPPSPIEGRWRTWRYPMEHEIHRYALTRVSTSSAYGLVKSTGVAIQ